MVSSSTGSMLFQSTLPWRGVTINIHIQTGIRMTFQSTLSMRRATQSLFLPLLAMPISIHALREESDCSSARSAESVSSFQSTLSVRRATFLIHRNLLRKNVFQSTLSVRRATWPLSSGPVSTRFQSTLSVRRATPSTKNHNTRGDYFNPRSP